MNRLSRRRFLAASAGAASIPTLAQGATGMNAAAPRSAEPHEGDDHRGVCVIASGNGRRACDRAWDRLGGGADPCVAVVDGVGIVEADPNDMTVGLGGLPNEHGVVQLDASVMHGPSHKAGAVACLEDIVHPAAVALEVLRRTDHVMLVGAGAKAFALQMGHEEADLLTEKARTAWVRWKRSQSTKDDWLDKDQSIEMGTGGGGPHGMAPTDAEGVPFTYGTIHCGAVDAESNIGATTTTSGLSWKIPGRVGDSPIIGAGMYVDNAVGSAGATGRGEAVIQSCGSFQAVRLMEQGRTPTEACLEVLRLIDRNTKRSDLRNANGLPGFNVTMYALRKDGAYGSACMRPGGSFAVRTAAGPAQRIKSVPLHA